MNIDELDTGYFEPGSDADAIFTEASEKLHAMLKGEIKETINWYEQAKKEICGLEGKIASLRTQKAHIEQQVADALKKADEAELNDIPARYINRFLKKYTGFYVPGDKVWVVTTKLSDFTCPLCRGEKTIEVSHDGNAMRIECPKCKGRGALTQRVSITKEETVTRVDLKLCFEGKRVNAWSGDCVYITHFEWSINPKCIFRTEAEAAAEAENQNRKRENESKNSNS